MHAISGQPNVDEHHEIMKSPVKPEMKSPRTRRLEVDMMSLWRTRRARPERPPEITPFVLNRHEILAGGGWGLVGSDRLTRDVGAQVETARRALLPRVGGHVAGAAVPTPLALLLLGGSGVRRCRRSSRPAAWSWPRRPAARAAASTRATSSTAAQTSTSRRRRPRRRRGRRRRGRGQPNRSADRPVLGVRGRARGRDWRLVRTRRERPRADARCVRAARRATVASTCRSRRTT